MHICVDHLGCGTGEARCRRTIPCCSNAYREPRHRHFPTQGPLHEASSCPCAAFRSSRGCAEILAVYEAESRRRHCVDRTNHHHMDCAHRDPLGATIRWGNGACHHMDYRCERVAAERKKVRAIPSLICWLVYDPCHDRSVCQALPERFGRSSAGPGAIGQVPGEGSAERGTAVRTSRPQAEAVNKNETLPVAV